MRRIVAAGILAVVMGMTPVLAHASIVFLTGNNPQPGEENVLLNSGTTGNPVFGVTNQTNVPVQFSSATDSLNVPSGGQARVEGEHGGLANISISVPGGTYTDVIINPFSGLGDPGLNAATVSVLTNEPGGGQLTVTFTYQLGNGNNFLTIVAEGGETIASTTIDAPNEFADLRQPRISGATRVPEPGVALLLGAALGALSLYRGRKSR